MVNINWFKRKLLLREEKFPLRTRVNTALARETFTHWRGNSSRIYALIKEVEKSNLPIERKTFLLARLKKQFEKNLADASAYANRALEQKAA